jgi:hypothetical protein
MRVCNQCKRLLPLAAFYVVRRRSGSVGRQGRCIECLKARKRGRSKAEIQAAAIAAFPERFWSYVDKRGPDECWPWTGYTHVGFGYGMISIAGQHAMLLSHRVALELSGVKIPEGLGALHKCDNPPCCNPRHLYPGNQQQNVRDMVERGRARGRFSHVA